MDRNATRKHAGDDSRSWSGWRYRSRFQERRNVARSALQRLRGSRRLSSTADARDSHADRAYALRRLQDSCDSDEHHGVLHKQDGHRRVSRRRPPEATYVVERALDLVAADLVDPAEVRRKNFLPPTSFRFTLRPVSITTVATTKLRSTRRRRSPLTANFAKSRRRRAKKDA